MSKKSEKSATRKAVRVVSSENHKRYGVPEIEFFHYPPGRIFYQNIMALQKHYPELAKRINKGKNNKRFFEVVGRSGQMPNLVDIESGQFYYRHGDPLNDEIQQIQSLKLKNVRLALFLGMGLGYGLLHFVQELSIKHNTAYILVVEKDLEIFEAAINSINLVSIIENPNIELIVGQEVDNLYPQFRRYLKDNARFRYLRAMKPIYDNSAILLHKDYYMKTLKSFKEAGIHEIRYYGNDPYDSLIGINHMLANLGEILNNPGINLLYNKFKGKPAVVVATGPSLNKNKHLLKGLENKALIISADASLKILMEMGVKPHLVTMLERVYTHSYLIEGFDAEQVKDVYLAACPVVNKAVYEKYTGPRIIVYRNFDHFKWLNIERGILEIKLSSGNMAFKLAQVMGCNPIILIGQDLAYSREGNTHATGFIHGEKSQGDMLNGTVMVKGNDGQPIPSNINWFEMLKAYELDLAGYNGKCINCTEGGAYINGTEVITFQEAIDTYINETFFPLEIIRESLKGFSLEEAINDLQKVLKLIDETLDDLQFIRENCQAGLEICEKYKPVLQSALHDPAGLEQVKDKLPEIEREILLPRLNCSQKMDTFQLFLMHVIQSVNIKIDMEIIAVPERYDLSEQAKMDILLRWTEWYAIIGDIVAICMQALRCSKDDLSNSSLFSNIDKKLGNSLEKGYKFIDSMYGV